MALTAQQLALQQKYQQAIADYQASWKHIDDALRPIVRQLTWTTLPDVHTKVVFVDGVYRAGLVRVVGRGATMRCATALLAAAPKLQPSIVTLSAFNGKLNGKAAMAVTAVHGDMLSVLPTSKKGKRPRSFASKFLHFHDPVVPLYDSQVRNNAPSLLALAGVSNADFGAASAKYPRPPGTDTTYYEHVLRVLLLWEALAVVLEPVALTVKGVDHMLFLG
jgi:hypothetical protein